MRTKLNAIGVVVVLSSVLMMPGRSPAQPLGDPHGPSTAPVDIVVHGLVQGLQTRKVGGLHMSRARLVVLQTLAGPEAAFVDVDLVGGAIAGIAQQVPGGLALRQGEEVVLFLAARPDGFVAAAGAAAKYRVVRRDGQAPAVVHDVPGALPIAFAELAASVDPARPALPLVPPAASATTYLRSTTYCGDESIPLRWFTPEVRYVVDAAGSTDIDDGSDLDAVRAGAQAWQDVRCSALDATFDGLVSGLTPGFELGGDNQNLMIWLGEGFPPVGGDALAVALLTYRCSDGEILDGDVVFNQAWPWTTTPESVPSAYDVQSVAAHEFGHVLGFDHSPDYASTMFPYTDLGVAFRRSLTLGDSLGLCDAYIADAVAGRDGRPPLPHIRGPAGAIPGTCGNGICESYEDVVTCSLDCANIECGDGQCEGFEDCVFCSADCGACVCGDGACQPGECATCASDCPDGCSCGDVCLAGPPQDASCGQCQADVCAEQPFCCLFFWDPLCVNLAELLCGSDCGLFCGDGWCGLDEDALTCPQDCTIPGYCGDGTCDPLDPFEGCLACPEDCGECVCGDGACSADECDTCVADCPDGCHCDDVCVEGPPQGESCGPCQADVCAADPFCCYVFWDLTCVGEAVDICGASCEP